MNVTVNVPRIIQAMKAKGWGVKDTCANLGTNNKTLRKILNGQVPQRLDAHRIGYVEPQSYDEMSASEIRLELETIEKDAVALVERVRKLKERMELIDSLQLRSEPTHREVKGRARGTPRKPKAAPESGRRAER